MRSSLECVALVVLMSASGSSTAAQGSCAMGFVCLHAESSSSSSGEENCSGDPLNLHDDAALKTAIAAYELGSARLEFVGCSTGRFGIRVRASASRKYEVTYRIDKNYGPKDYLAPLLHELSHAFQSEHSGGMGKLKDTLSIDQIELGADFLTGLLFGTRLEGGKLEDFQTSLELFGDYDPTQVDSHGRPEDRIAAFRFGYFFKGKRSGQTLWEAHEEFQRDYYPKLMEM